MTKYANAAGGHALKAMFQNESKIGLIIKNGAKDEISFGSKYDINSLDMTSISRLNAINSGCHNSNSNDGLAVDAFEVIVISSNPIEESHDGSDKSLPRADQKKLYDWGKGDSRKKDPVLKSMGSNSAIAMAKIAKKQILNEAEASILGQANAKPKGAFALLQ